MTVDDPARQAAAVALADAIPAEYNDSSSKLTGFSAALIGMIAACEKSLKLKGKGRA